MTTVNILVQGSDGTIADETITALEVSRVPERQRAFVTPAGVEYVHVADTATGRWVYRAMAF